MRTAVLLSMCAVLLPRAHSLAQHSLLPSSDQNERAAFLSLKKAPKQSDALIDAYLISHPEKEDDKLYKAQLLLWSGAKYANINMIKRALKDGADIHAGYPDGPDQGETAVHMAIDSGDLETLKFVLQNGGKADTPDRRGESPLLQAAVSGHIEAVRLLLQSKADINRKNVSGVSPLLAVSSETFRRGDEVLPVFELLLTKQADVNTIDKRGLTPLIMSACDHQAVTKLLAHTAAKTINQVANNGNSALLNTALYLQYYSHIIVNEKRLAALRLLYDRGVRIDNRLDDGRDVLWVLMEVTLNHAYNKNLFNLLHMVYRRSLKSSVIQINMPYFKKVLTPLINEVQAYRRRCGPGSHDTQRCIKLYKETRTPFIKIHQASIIYPYVLSRNKEALFRYSRNFCERKININNLHGLNMYERLFVLREAADTCLSKYHSAHKTKWFYPNLLSFARHFPQMANYVTPALKKRFFEASFYNEKKYFESKGSAYSAPGVETLAEVGFLYKSKHPLRYNTLNRFRELVTDCPKNDTPAQVIERYKLILKNNGFVSSVYVDTWPDAGNSSCFRKRKSANEREQTSFHRVLVHAAKLCSPAYVREVVRHNPNVVNYKNIAAVQKYFAEMSDIICPLEKKMSVFQTLLAAYGDLQNHPIVQGNAIRPGMTWFKAAFNTGYSSAASTMWAGTRSSVSLNRYLDILAYNGESEKVNHLLTLYRPAQFGNALYLASSAQSLDSVMVLYKAGAKVNSEVLVYLAENPEGGMVLSTILKEKTLSQNTLDRALRFACQRSVSNISLFINAGANVNARDEHGNTALHYGYRKPCLPLLLKNKVDVNARNQRGQTVLMLAAGSAPKSSINVLRKAGARVDLMDKLGRRAVEYSGREEIKAMLKTGE